MAALSLPTFTDTIDLKWFIEPISGSTHPRNLLDRFPDSVYNTSPDSHLTRFLYSLLGPAGVGWLRKNYADARLALEAHGIELFDLEKYYGDPFSFGRVLEEYYADDPTGLLTRAQWDEIKAKDESYRTRALDFFKAARLGTSPGGMELAARSGLGHNAEVVENYRYLFDAHSDDPLGLPYFGRTTSTEEFVVLPRQTVSRSSVQTISFDPTATQGTYVLVFNGGTTVNYTYNGVFYSQIPFAADLFHVQAALRSMQNIGQNGVIVSGGPAPLPFTVTFAGPLSNRSVPLLSVLNGTANISGQSTPITITENTGGLDASQETVRIPEADQHAMQTALDLLRPVASIPTVNAATGLSLPVLWNSALASSEYREVVRFVTGTPAIRYPAVDNTHWIVSGQEIQAPRIHDDRQQHYVGFHNIQGVVAYTDTALSDPQYDMTTAILGSYPSVHAGAFVEDAAANPILADFTDSAMVFGPLRALADYPEPLTVTTQDGSSTGFINGIYPVDYTGLPGAPQIVTTESDFWASADRTAGAEILEIDLGSAMPVNYITFEALNKTMLIDIAFDLWDMAPGRYFAPVHPSDPSYESAMTYDPSQENPWRFLEYRFDDGNGDMPFTRFLRIRFTRQPGFMVDTVTALPLPWGFQVRNLRVGRNVV